MANQNKFYNVQHSPIGAFSSFTLGFKGKKGGLASELGKPADQNIYIGMQARDGSVYEALPFFEAAADESSRYDVEKVEPSDKDQQATAKLRAFNDDQISRTLGAGTDTWQAGDVMLRIYSPVRSVPDPATASPEELKQAIVPAVFAELTLDNSKGSASRRGFIGYEGSDPYSAMRRLGDTSGGQFEGIGQGRLTAIACDADDVQSALGFTMEKILDERYEHNYAFGLGGTGAILMEVPPGETRTYKFAICFYRDGIVTTGIEASYAYTRYFKNINSVAAYALEHFQELTLSCQHADQWINDSKLSVDQKFMLSHAIHSYYGSTQMLDHDGKALWIVNEGEYRMMNTLDLTVDQLFLN